MVEIATPFFTIWALCLAEIGYSPDKNEERRNCLKKTVECFETPFAECVVFPFTYCYDPLYKIHACIAIREE